MPEERMDQLLWLWTNEDYSPASREWRKSLTPEEAKKVAEWDGNC